MKKTIIIVLSIVICFAIGFLGSRFQTESLLSWYPHINKPTLTPPNIAFPIAWSILYACMGISIGLIINSKCKKRSLFIGLFVIQLILNFTWSISFFYFQNPLLGLINILLLLVFIIGYAISTYPSMKISSLLFTPYIIWVSFATYLNAYILINN